MYKLLIIDLFGNDAASCTGTINIKETSAWVISLLLMEAQLNVLGLSIRHNGDAWRSERDTAAASQETKMADADRVINLRILIGQGRQLNIKVV